MKTLLTYTLGMIVLGSLSILSAEGLSEENLILINDSISQDYDGHTSPIRGSSGSGGNSGGGRYDDRPIFSPIG